MNGGKDDEIVARDDFEESLEALTITTTDEDSEEGPRHKKKKRKIACAECDKTSGTEGEVEADAKQGHLVCKKCGHIANELVLEHDIIGKGAHKQNDEKTFLITNGQRCRY